MTARAVAIAIALAGCGRVEFEARTDAGDGSGDSGPAAICHTGTWSTPTLVAAIATGSEEADPSLSPDQRTLYFESNQPLAIGRGLWRTTRATTSDAFGPPEMLNELDTANDERDPQIMAGGERLYFTGQFGSVVWIAIATRPSSTGLFAPATIVEIVGEAASSTFTPFVMPDELTLYYGHNLGMAVATRPTTSDKFTFVRDLTEIDSAQTDLDPSLTPDGLELFFGSYRTGQGAIFHSMRTSTSDPFLVVSEIVGLAGADGAGAPEISADGRTLYFWQSDGSQLDIYTSTRTCD